LSIVNGFSHLVIHVTDLDQSEAFYHDVIGLDVIGRDLVNDQGPNLLLAMNTRQRALLVEVPEAKFTDKLAVPLHMLKNSINQHRLMG